MKNLFSFIGLCFIVISQAQTISINSFATGLTQPLDIENAGDSRLFVVEKTGRIKIVNSNGTINTTPFLDISSLVTTNSERGLLGLAFHPNYQTNGLFFIDYTDLSGNTQIAKYSVNTTNPDIANPTGTILLSVTQPFDNHNGGTIKFGPDGYLYIGMGDGGSGGDPGNRAQNSNENLGKMLRIDVNTGSPYGIPAGNPYVGVAGNDEIWAIGLRNPWKFSFDRTTGDLYIADVGQNAVEEVNKVASTAAGLNYGWRCYEGNVAYNTSGCAAQNTMVSPLTVVNHTSGSCSITGGYVYRGTTYPNLIGKYIFTDYCNPKIGYTDTTTGLVTYSAAFSGNNFVSFGEDFNGELYLCSIGGTLYKVIDTALSVTEFNPNKAFKIYPNPSKNEIRIENSASIYPIAIVIADVNGKILLDHTPLNIEKNTVNTSSLSRGIYMMRITNNLETISTHKLVIN